MCCSAEVQRQAVGGRACGLSYSYSFVVLKAEQSAYFSVPAPCSAWRDTFCGWSHSFFRKEKAWKNASSLSFPCNNVEKIPCPIFITSEVLLLAARCAETPDDSIYSLRGFNRLTEIWVESMSAAQPHTSAGDAQKACCCFEFLLQSGESQKLHELGTFYGWLRRIMSVQLAANLCSFKHSFYRAQEKYGTWLACFCWMVAANRWLLKTGGKANKEDKKKMQFETLRQVCNSVLSHFHGVFSSPPNILQNELFGQTLNNARWVKLNYIFLILFSEK